MKACIEPAVKGEGGILREFVERARFAWQAGRFQGEGKVVAEDRRQRAAHRSACGAMRVRVFRMRWRRAQRQPVHVGRGRIVAVVSESISKNSFHSLQK